MLPPEFVTGNALLLHVIGDYVLQSDWMAQKKATGTLEGSFAVLAHAATYTVPFLLLTQHWKALLFIFGTHALIDRYRLARYMVFAKNFLGSRATWKPWSECSNTGYSNDRPAWLTVWLYIIADNVLHVICNALALHFWRSL